MVRARSRPLKLVIEVASVRMMIPVRTEVESLVGMTALLIRITIPLRTTFEARAWLLRTAVEGSAARLRMTDPLRTTVNNILVRTVVDERDRGQSVAGMTGPDRGRRASVELAKARAETVEGLPVREGPSVD